MYKGIFLAGALSLLLAAPALAHDKVGNEGAAAHAAPGSDSAADPASDPAAGEAPGPTAVPGPPSVESATAKAEVEYRFGVNGFLRGEGTGNFRLSDLGYDPQHAEGRFLYRVKPYAFWHPTDYLDLHLEGQGYGFAGGGEEQGKVYLYQGYLEAKLPGSDLFALKAGRQEFSYGSNFMLGPDAFYDGLSFDSARLRVQPTKELSIDLLGGYYAAPSAGGVTGNISGAYATWTRSEGNALEGYYLRDTGSTVSHAGEELDSFGLRATAKLGFVALEFEPVYQGGEVFDDLKGGNDSISAFGGHADLTAEQELAGFHHKFWLGYALGSGSRAAADGTSSKHQFRNPDNDTAIIGDMHAVGDLSGIDVEGHHASGFHIYTLGWGVDLTKEITLSATGHYFQAFAVESGFSRNLGLETDFSLTYNFSQEFSLILAYDRFFTGSFFRQASGSGGDIHYGYAMLQFNLEKSRLKPPKTEKGA